MKESSKPHFDSTLRISAKTLDFLETPLPSAQQTPLTVHHEMIDAPSEKTPANSSQNDISLHHRRIKPPVNTVSREQKSPRKPQIRPSRTELIKQTAAKVAKKVAKLKDASMSGDEAIMYTGRSCQQESQTNIPQAQFRRVPKLKLEANSAEAEQL